MTARQVELTNFGFFLYLVKGGKCHQIVVPHVAPVAHTAVLFVSHDTAITGHLPVPPDRFDDVYLRITLDGLSISPNSSGPAQLQGRTGPSRDEPGFDWVPDFTQTCCGVKLNPNWRQSPGLRALFTMGGGHLRAEEDGHTCREEWSWTLCDGTYHTQRVTTLTTYAIDVGAENSMTLICRDLHTEHEVARITIGVDSPPALLVNLPTSVFNHQKSETHLVELSHMQAALGFCVPTGKDIWIPSKYRTEKPCSIPPGLPPGPLGQFIIFHEGTPECSGESIPMP